MITRASQLPSGGYAWWYFDAVSDDGARALTAIFFVGSVFSPDYAARSRRGEAARADEHLAVNLALYEHGRVRAWVMSEYGPEALGPISAAGPTIGDSSIVTDAAGRVRVRVRERAAPFLAALAGIGGRIEGELLLEPQAAPLAAVELGREPGHRWELALPRARVRARFDHPSFAFEGVGYHDRNSGTSRLEEAFERWSWARFHPPDRTVVLYAARERGGGRRALVVDTRDDDGAPRAVEAPPAQEGALRGCGWGLRMPAWFELDAAGHRYRCAPERPIERSPFYTRYLGQLGIDGGAQVAGLGEYLDLDRFRAPAVQFLLRFKTRVPRGPRGG